MIEHKKTPGGKPTGVLKLLVATLEPGACWGIRRACG